MHFPADIIVCNTAATCSAALVYNNSIVLSSAMSPIMIRQVDETAVHSKACSWCSQSNRSAPAPQASGLLVIMEAQNFDRILEKYACGGELCNLQVRCQLDHCTWSSRHS